MSWIKNLLLAISAALISYIILIVGDWYLFRTMKTISENINSEAILIEDNRVKTEDLLMRSQAVENGYLPALYPQLIDLLRGTKYQPEQPIVGGFPYSKTYYCNEGYGLTKYISDRFGFRNDDNKWEKPIEAVFIGDSFVHGACVKNSSTIPSVYEALSLSNTVNLGMASSNPSHYLTFAHLFIPKALPKKVFLVFYPNDNATKNKSAIEMAFVDEGVEFFSKDQMTLINHNETFRVGMHLISAIKEREAGKTIQKPLSFFDPYFFANMYSAIARHALLPKITSMLNVRHKNTNFEYTERTIIKTKNICKIFDCELSIIFIPNSKFYRPDSKSDSYGDRIKVLTSSLSLKFYDGRDVISRKKESLDYAIKGPHLSPLGYGKIARMLTDGQSQ